MGINQFHDRDVSEMHFGLDTSSASSHSVPDHELASTCTFTYPAAVDWSARADIVGPVTNQGNCGSCWAFSSVAAVESAIALKTGASASLNPISQQHVVDCDTLDGGCNGGWPTTAFNFLAKAPSSSSNTGGYFPLTGYSTYA